MKRRIPSAQNAYGNRNKHRRPKIRAHLNPLSTSSIETPLCPSFFDCGKHFPSAVGEDASEVTVADIGCGFGGLLENLSPLLPNDLILGMEIRGQVVEKVQERLVKLRSRSISPQERCSRWGPFQNVSVVLANAMKSMPNYFRKGQLRLMFFCFPDPHWKRKTIRRRIISYTLLSVYAYCLCEEGRVYIITDVKDLFEWMHSSFTQHPLFVEVKLELESDALLTAMEQTDEGLKVTRNKGKKFAAAFMRLKNPMD